MNAPHEQPRRTLRELALTVLGTGHLRPAPATWASLASVALFAAIVAGGRAVGIPVARLDPLLPLAGAIAASGLSVLWGEWAIRRFAHKDPRQFVLDEFAGQWLALAWLPVALSGTAAPLAMALFGQFVLFRFFDIVQVPPAYQLQRLPAGWGVLADDLMAGVYANLAGQLLWRYAPPTAWFAAA